MELLNKEAKKSKAIKNFVKSFKYIVSDSDEKC